MELEGLQRSLTFLKDNNVPVSDLITDRHSSVKKYMREKQPDIHHWFDVWHVAKGKFHNFKRLCPLFYKKKKKNNNNNNNNKKNK